jgi:GNAT superfamily N-acetyltransferase
MIYEAKDKNLIDIIYLYKQLFPDEGFNDTIKNEKIWAQIVNDDKISCYISYERNIPVATCIMTVIPNLTHEQRPYAIIENVVTNTEYRKRGFGKLIIEYAIKNAKEQNCYKIMLLSSSKRIEAHKFYERIGFDGNSKKGYQIRFI